MSSPANNNYSDVSRPQFSDFMATVEESGVFPGEEDKAVAEANRLYQEALEQWEKTAHEPAPVARPLAERVQPLVPAPVRREEGEDIPQEVLQLMENCGLSLEEARAIYQSERGVGPVEDHHQAPEVDVLNPHERQVLDTLRASGLSSAEAMLRLQEMALEEARQAAPRRAVRAQQQPDEARFEPVVPIGGRRNHSERIFRVIALIILVSVVYQSFFGSESTG